jgi:hypothetical protein
MVMDCLPVWLGVSPLSMTSCHGVRRQGVVSFGAELSAISMTSYPDLHARRGGSRSQFIQYEAIFNVNTYGEADRTRFNLSN